MFKRGEEPKHSLGLGIADYHQEFWEFTSLSFYENSDYQNLISYIWVIPVYVYSLNSVWNGETTFDVSPINYGLPENETKGWTWRRTCEKKHIGERIFHTKEEAWEAYFKRYTEKQHQENKERRWKDLRKQAFKRMVARRKQTK